VTHAAPPSHRFRVVIVGAGVGALEAALALADLAPELTEVTLIAPNDEFVYRPMVVREPFAYASASRYPIARIAADAGATLLRDRLAWIDPTAHVVHTEGGEAVEYDALLLALGAHAGVRYEHALTIDDRRLDEILHGVVQDIEGDYLHSIAFVAPPGAAWPLPLYELAMMSAGRAFDMGIELATTIVTSEESPLAIFGATVSSAVAELLREAKVQVITSAYAEVPRSGEVALSPGERLLRVDRVVALPELHGPRLRGIPLGDHGFIRIDPYGRVPHVEDIYAAGDATSFPIKHGGLAAQQADVAAQSIAAQAGAPVTPQRFDPVINGMLLTNDRPRYLTAHITGGDGFSSAISDSPSWSPPGKIVARYLAPYLVSLESEDPSGGQAVAQRPAAPAARRSEHDKRTGAEARGWLRENI
jgi:sulfide:quinone oxidoreductase